MTESIWLANPGARQLHLGRVSVYQTGSLSVVQPHKAERDSRTGTLLNQPVTSNSGNGLAQLTPRWRGNPEHPLALGRRLLRAALADLAEPGER